MSAEEGEALPAKPPVHFAGIAIGSQAILMPLSVFGSAALLTAIPGGIIAIHVGIPDSIATFGMTFQIVLSCLVLYATYKAWCRSQDDSYSRATTPGALTINEASNGKGASISLTGDTTMIENQLQNVLAASASRLCLPSQVTKPTGLVSGDAGATSSLHRLSKEAALEDQARTESQQIADLRTLKNDILSSEWRKEFDDENIIQAIEVIEDS